MGVRLKSGEDLGHFGAVGEVADLDTGGGEGLAELAEFLFIGVVVDAVEGGEFFAFGEVGDGFVGGEHELFDELVALVVFDFFEAVGVALFIHEDLGLGHVEIEAAVFHAGDAEAASDRPELANPTLEIGEFLGLQRGEGAAGGAGLVFGREGEFTDGGKVVGKEECVGLFVGEALTAADDGVGEGGGLEAAFGVEDEEGGFGEAVLALDERAEAVGDFLGQHGHDGADEVGGVAAFLGFAVEGGAGFHVGGNVGDVDADAGEAAVDFFERKGVVEVFGVIGVDGERRDPAVIEAALGLGGLDVIGQGPDLGLDGGRKGRVEVELAVNAEELRAGLKSLAEALGDLALGGTVGVVPRVEAHDDLVAGAGGFVEFVGRWVLDGDLVDETRVVGGDVETFADLMEGADDGGVGALDDLGDLAVLLVFAALARGSAGPVEDAHAHGVTVEGEADVFGRDLDGRRKRGAGFGVGGGGGEHVGGAAGAELEAADEGLVVGRVAADRESDLIAGDEDELAAREQEAELVGELAADFFIDARETGESGCGGRTVARGFDRIEDAGTELHDDWIGSEGG